MRSGNRRRGYSDSPWAALAVLVLIALASCGSGTRFDRALALLDDELGASAVGKAGTKIDPGKATRLVDRAAGRADASSEWLRLMARSFRVSQAVQDFDVAVRVAERARKAYPLYEDIALCACRAYLDAGRPADALALFPIPLDPHLHGSWYAQAFLAAYQASRRDTPGSCDAEALRLVAQGSKRGEPAVDAALLRMAAGDPDGAAAFLRYAKSLGTEVDGDLAWDAGMSDLLLADPERGSSGKELLRKADAALIMGELEWAREYLMEAVLAFPDYSWKPYASLAALEREGLRGDYWYDRMAEFFPSNPEAVRARASHLARKGRGDEALAALAVLAPDKDKPGEFPGDPKTAVLAGELRARGGPADREAVEAVRISNEFPDDPYAQRWALGRLAAAERYSQVAQIYRQLRARGIDPGRTWYYEALVLILDGRLREAAQVIERDGPADSGPDAPFALGILYARLGDYGTSVERLRIAVSAAEDPEARVRALTEMGKSLAAAGNRKEAREAWEAALSILPDAAEPLRLHGSRPK